MRRISFVLLPALLLAALVPFGSFTVAARARYALVTATATGPDGNDCDHDGGHDPADDVCTPTATAIHTPVSTPVGTPVTTPTAPVCSAHQANFGSVPVGSSVQGMGAVVPNVSITARYSAVHIQANVAPEIYGAGPQNKSVNGGVDALKDAFGDVQAHQNNQAAHFAFTFSPGLTATDFRLHMLDFGDFNPLFQTNHLVIMRAFNASNLLIASQTLSYTTPATLTPTSSNKYGNLQINGDALSAPAGMPGNWIWHVSGTGITRVTLDVAAGPDPNFALDGLYVTFRCP